MLCQDFSTLSSIEKQLLLLYCCFLLWLAGIGRKGVYLYNLPEVMSAFKYIKVPGVSARFGTDPFIWNWAMWIVARVCPPQFLQDRSQVR
jgi:hypothetical protein